MKAFIIHIKGNKSSEKTANWAYESCVEHGYEPKMFEGITPKTLNKWDKKYNLTVMNPSHMYDRQIGKNGTNWTYECKYSNFLNHYTLWNKCIELDEPIVVLEHDVFAEKPWGDTQFDEMLVLNMHSGLHQNIFDGTSKPTLIEGIHTYVNPFLNYKSKNIWLNAGMIPGTAAYAISPKGAKRIINNVKKHGWDKADYIINTKSIHMQYAFPDYFELSHYIFGNQRTSHGENI
jgi:GR25 family glycosyltransferase involved in LPS biosynthesis